MDDLSLDELRALVRRRRQAVTAKIARTRRSTGAEVSGTKYDPRVDNGVAKRYTRKQLQSAVGKYEAFLARGNQFHADAENRPITRQAWTEYKAAERTLNQESAARRARFDNVDLPGKNMTYKQHRAATQPDFPTAGNPAVNDPYPEYNRKSTDIASADRLKALTKALLKRARPSGYEKPLRDAKDVLAEMFDVTQAEDMKKAIGKLNRKQFEYLWNVSGFAQAKSTWYHLSKRALEGHVHDWLDDVGDSMADDAWGYIRDAKKVK